MIRHAASYPETLRATDWRDAGACRSHDEPEWWFASEQTATSRADLEKARTICRTCPVMEMCWQWALETRQAYGMWGGVSENRRRAMLRRKGVKVPTDVPDEPDKEPNTFRSVWDARHTILDGGHIGWTGGIPVYVRGRFYTPQQVGFRLDRGRPPVGVLRRTCEVRGCVDPRHYRDQRERDAARAAGERAAV